MDVGDKVIIQRFRIMLFVRVFQKKAKRITVDRLIFTCLIFRGFLILGLFT